MRRIGDQDGGVLAKTLALLLIVALLGAGAMYVVRQTAAAAVRRERDPARHRHRDGHGPARARRSRVRGDDRAQRRHVPGHPPRLGRHAGAARPTVCGLEHRPRRRQDRESRRGGRLHLRRTQAGRGGRHLRRLRAEPGVDLCQRHGTPPRSDRSRFGSAPTASNRRRRSRSPALPTSRGSHAHSASRRWAARRSRRPIRRPRLCCGHDLAAHRRTPRHPGRSRPGGCVRRLGRRGGRLECRGRASRRRWGPRRDLRRRSAVRLPVATPDPRHHRRHAAPAPMAVAEDPPPGDRRARPADPARPRAGLPLAGTGRRGR